MVDMSNHVRRGHPVAFGLLTFISIIVAIIASALTADYNKNHDTQPDDRDSSLVGRVRFFLFVGWWTVIFSAIYLGLFLTGVGGVFTSIAGHGIWLLLTWLFWTAAAGALSNAVGTSCSPGYYYCNSLRALQAFGWIGWIIISLMLVIVAVIGGGAFRGGRGVKGGLSEA